MPRWSDNPATTTTRIRAAHINELRHVVDFFRQKNGLPGYSWTDGPWADTTTRIMAVNFTELRQATQDIWTVKGMGTIPNWSAGTAPAVGGRILASHVNDLRGWVDQADPPLNIWTGFHWCSPVLNASSDTAKGLLQTAGRWGSVIILERNQDPADPNSRFRYACDRVMDARDAVGGGRSLDQAIVRILFPETAHPNVTDIPDVATAESWLASYRYYDNLDYFINNGGRNVVIFNELDNVVEPQKDIDQRVMGYLSYALQNHYWNGGNRLLFTLFPGPSSLIAQGSFDAYWDRYDLRSGGPGTHQTFVDYFGPGNVDPAIDSRTMLWHGGTGAFDRVAVHCYENNINRYISNDPAVNQALRDLQWHRDRVDSSGWVYVTETGGYHQQCDDFPVCRCGDVAVSGRGLAAFQSNGNAQFGSPPESFLQAVYGYILNDSDCGANANGSNAIGSTFINEWNSVKDFP